MEAIKIKGETVLLQDNVLLISFDEKRSQTIAVMAKIKAGPNCIINAAVALFKHHPELIALFTLAAQAAFYELQREGKL